MFFPQRSTLISLVLPLFFSMGAQALPNNYGTSHCVEHHPDQPTQWILEPLENSKQSITQPIRWMLTIRDADGELMFTKVKFKVSYMPANAKSSHDVGTAYPVLEFGHRPGSQLLTFNTPGISGYKGYFAYIEAMDFLDERNNIVKSVAVNTRDTLNASGIKGTDFRMENDGSIVKLASGMSTDIIENDYMYSGSYRFDIRPGMTCDEHSFPNSYWPADTGFNHNGTRFIGQYITFGLDGMGANSEWSCNYTVKSSGLKIAGGGMLIFERRGFRPIAATKPTIFHSWQNTYQDAYFNLKTSGNAASGSMAF